MAPAQQRLSPHATEATEATEPTIHEGIAGAVAAYGQVLSASMGLRSRATGGEAPLVSQVSETNPLFPAGATGMDSKQGILLP